MKCVGSRSHVFFVALGVILLINVVVTLCVFVWKPLFSPPATKTSSRFRRGVVAADSKLCSEMGRDTMLVDGGNAVDAAIVTALCLGIVHPHSSGIGGGGVWLLRTSSGSYECLNARERAPESSFPKMYVGRPRSESTRGPKSVAVPGEVAGMIEMHSKHGSMAWEKLFQRPIELAKKGIAPNRAVRNAWRETASSLNITWDFPELNAAMNGGSFIQMPKLAKTFERIAKNKWSFYKSDLGDEIAAELNGSYVSRSDLMNYRVEQCRVVETKAFGTRILSTASPFGGPIVLAALNLLEEWTTSTKVDDEVALMHGLVEVLKLAYSKRLSLGENPSFRKASRKSESTLLSKSFARKLVRMISSRKVLRYSDILNHAPVLSDHGTTHMVATDASGMTVGYTSTINLYFGSALMGSKTGILYNDEMDDFSVPQMSNTFGYPPSPANFPSSGSFPMSSMAPLFMETKRGIYSLGASGGSRIISSVAQVVAHILLKGRDLHESISRPRLHHQFIPDALELEHDFASSVSHQLGRLGHRIVKKDSTWMDGIVQGVLRSHDDGSLEAVSDRRKGGQPAGY